MTVALPFGMRLRASAVDRHVRAVYLFYRSGEPVAMVASDRSPPMPSEQLEPIVGTVRDFVETSVPQSEGYDVTSLRFDEETLVAVRGQHLSICAIFRSRGAASIRRDRLRFLRDFEGRNEGRLNSWEDACRFTGQATDGCLPSSRPESGYLETACTNPRGKRSSA